MTISPPAFDEVGDSAIAGDLALGLVMSWIPVFVLCNIVDRNPISAEYTHRKINKYFAVVRNALLNDPSISDDIAASLDMPRTSAYDWSDGDGPVFLGDVLCEFAGQGRFHWHHGVGHPIVASIADRVAQVGRGWLDESLETRRALLWGNMSAPGILWHDPRRWWKIVQATLLLLGTAAGAFWISFWTPTVGLSCHSGGYLIYISISVFNFVLETGFERFANPRQMTSRKTLCERIMVAMELVGTCWLVYITIAATFGLYETCECLAADWDPYGGFIDLDNLNGELTRPVLP